MVSTFVRPQKILRKSASVDAVATVAAVVCATLLLLAVIGPWIAPYDPSQTDVLAAGQGPSVQHLLGTDSLGRDVLSRLLTGARLSFLGPGIIVVVSSTAGTALAIAAAWFGGTLDSVLNKVLNVGFALPGILVAILAAAIFGSGFWAPVVALSLVYIPFVARVIRSSALVQRNMNYIEACELAGMSRWRICVGHILRNVAPLVVAQSTILFGSALMDFAATSFLGVGVQPPASEWGLMVSDGRTELLSGALQQTLAASVLIVTTVVAFNVLGERLSATIGGRK